jgi:hypothetical protein
MIPSAMHVGIFARFLLYGVGVDSGNSCSFIIQVCLRLRGERDLWMFLFLLGMFCSLGDFSLNVVTRNFEKSMILYALSG